MIGQFSYGYLKEAVKAHLDLEEDELEALNINQRFHIFANEAIQQICYTKPKQVYFQFTAVNSFTPLVYADGILRVATLEEQNWQVHGNPEPIFATDIEVADWYNNQHIYLVGQVISMPSDFLTFATKQAFMWSDYISNKQPLTNKHVSYLSNNELLVYFAANYLIPYNASWTKFTQDNTEDAIINMPADLLLTIPIYVASVCLQQRNLNMATAKRQEFELAVSRCRVSSLLENRTVTPTFK
jgi:hypothetical protein